MRKIFLPLLAAMAVFPGTVGADDQDRALEAVRRGEILPLADILAVVDARFGGRVIEIELDADDGVYVYEMELVSAQGRLYEVYVDAKSGRIIEAEAEYESYDDDYDDYDNYDDWD
ncbi:MAG: PepSY domain-containing protein [Phyllobacteriaceae bacterium]|jgi:uncharacterized membrane protein YkoI|nr:PepSY domain-containing protein [Phyllobacteriaceae bacterium]